MNNNDQLDSFDSSKRRIALETLLADGGLPEISETAGINMHLHSFFSFNASDYSPSRLAWEARKQGLYAAGLCDFDVLEGLEEFLDAGYMLGLRTSVSLETRAFFTQMASMDINSPGEPGVTYVMGAGFARVPQENSPQYSMLLSLQNQADARNRSLVNRINDVLPELAIDYDEDVMRLTPGGCPTERHIVRAYGGKMKSVFDAPARFNKYLADLLGITEQEAVTVAGNNVELEEKLRGKLVKRGGVGYEPPTAKTFPPLNSFIDWVRECEAIPMIAWLDGTTPGEKDAGKLVERMVDLGACAINIIPDRNHNISDLAARELKIQKLDEIVRLAQEYNMPVNIGTEMNKAGQPDFDDLNCHALRPFRQIFMDGARIMVGHTLMSRFANYSYTGAAENEYAGKTADKNEFFARVGALPVFTRRLVEKISEKEPDQALSVFKDSAHAGSWLL
ncbi:MAG: hypothetical protein GX811_12535 [Lentisphaerae bacterium]|nr:hypothetical protein [Lentisphaerota bacterium]